MSRSILQFDRVCFVCLRENMTSKKRNRQIYICARDAILLVSVAPIAMRLLGYWTEIKIIVNNVKQ